MSQLTLVLREVDKPAEDWKRVTLGENEQLLQQVQRNRLWRRVYKHLKAVNDNEVPIVPDMLLINVMVPGGEAPVQCTVDSRALLIRSFAPNDPASKRAIHEAASLVIYTANNPKDSDNPARLARADELQWLAITGNLPKEVKAKKNTYVSTGSSSEPTIGDGTLATYQDL